MAKHPTGHSQKRKPEKVTLVFADIEVSYSKGDKPFIGDICILDEKEKILFCKHYGDPTEITPKDIKEILDYYYKNVVAVCDPTLDLMVLKHDARRCGIKLKSSKIKFLDIQLIEARIQKKSIKRRISLQKIAKKYNIQPSIKFHDAYSDALVIKNILFAQIKKLQSTKIAIIENLID